jgi:uncharacterized protein YndB with AHSA1/START domain
MELAERIKVTVQVTINASIETVWECWNDPVDIVKWYNASPDWHTPRATNDLSMGGKFNYRMEAKDGSMGFDFEGIYDFIDPYRQIDYTLGDERKVRIAFSTHNNTTEVVETFDAEEINSIELQQNGWQSILNNFKCFVESQTVYV